MAKRIMRALKLNEISAVDRPAQAHARMLIMKRDETKPTLGARIAAATAALRKSAWSIFKDPDAANKTDLLKESFTQFEDHLTGLLPDVVEKAAEADTGDALKLAKDQAMTDEEKKIAAAAVEEAKKNLDELATAKAALAKANRENAILKMAPAHKAYFDTAGLSAAEAEAFIAKSADERAAYIEKNSIVKKLPDEVQKALDRAAANEVILKQLMEDKEVTAFAKRAVGLGLEEAHGEVLRKAYAGDAASITKLEQLLKGLSEQVRTGTVFKEFGTSQSNAGATAKAEMDAVAEDYRKGQQAAGKTISKHQAFTAIYTDPTHADLKKRYDAEEAMAKRKAA
jgi:hypothetical protein